MVGNYRRLLQAPKSPKGNISRYGRIPYLPPDNHLLRPEDKHNRRFRQDPIAIVHTQFIKSKNFTRGMRVINYFIEPNRWDEMLHKYSQRINLQPVFILFMLGQLFGCTLYYLNHKLRVIEPHMVEEYGRDYPMKRVLLPLRYYYEYRVKWWYF